MWEMYDEEAYFEDNNLYDYDYYNDYISQYEQEILSEQEEYDPYW